MHRFGRVATRCAAWFAPPHKSRIPLAYLNEKGYIAASATIHHADLHIGKNVFMDDRVVIYQREEGGPMRIGDRVSILRDTIIETGQGGSFSIGHDSSIHPRCQINAYVSPIEIGSGVMLAPACGLYPYDHGVSPDLPIRMQDLTSKGGIVIGDEAWLAFGVIVLGGVRIGKGAAIGAGSIVTHDIPDYAVAVGAPARVVKMRTGMQEVEADVLR